MMGMDMKSQNYLFSAELYESLTEEQRDKISLEMLYNSICHFHSMRENDIIEFLMQLSEDEYVKLEEGFKTIRQNVRDMQSSIMESGSFDEVFRSPEIEDILFYQISNDLPIG